MNKDILCRPFATNQLKQREGQRRKMLTYVETHAVIARLNEGCDAWSYEVVEHQVYDNEIVVLGKLTADGVTKSAFGGSAITVDGGGRIVSLADDLKSAGSDALKKCASLLGVGLELYGGGRQPDPGPPQTRSATTPRQPSGPRERPRGETPAPMDRLTQKQLGAIQGAARRRSMANQELSELLEERTGKQRLELLTRQEASNLISELNDGMNGAHP